MVLEVGGIASLIHTLPVLWKGKGLEWKTRAGPSFASGSSRHPMRHPYHTDVLLGFRRYHHFERSLLSSSTDQHSLKGYVWSQGCHFLLQT